MARAQILRLVLCTLLVALIVLALSAVFVRWAATQSFGHRFVEAQIARQSVRGQTVRVEGLSGDLFKSAKAQQATVSDTIGAWLTVQNAALDWQLRDLLSGSVSIDALDVDEINLLRPPVLAPSKENGGSLKSVRLSQVSIRMLTVDAAFAGREAILTAKGSATLNGAAGRVAFQMSPLDAATRDKADVALDWSATSPLSGQVRADGPEGGLIAGLLRLKADLAPILEADFVRDTSGEGMDGKIVVSANSKRIFDVTGEWSPTVLRGRGTIDLSAFAPAKEATDRLGNTVTFDIEPASGSALSVDAVAQTLTLKARVPFDFKSLKPDLARVPVDFSTAAVQRLTQQDEFSARIVRGSGDVSIAEDRLSYDGTVAAEVARFDLGTAGALSGPARIVWRRKAQQVDIRATLNASGMKANFDTLAEFADGSGVLDFEGIYDRTSKSLGITRAKATPPSGVYTARGTYTLGGPKALSGDYAVTLQTKYPAQRTQGRWRAEGANAFHTVRLEGQALGVRNVATYINGRDANYTVQLRKLGSRWRLEDALIRAPGIEANLSGDVVNGAVRGKINVAMRDFTQSRVRFEGLNLIADVTQTATGIAYDGQLTARRAHVEREMLDSVLLSASGTARDANFITGAFDGRAQWRGSPVTLQGKATRDGDLWTAHDLIMRRAGLDAMGELSGVVSVPSDIQGVLTARVTKASGFPFEGQIRVAAPRGRESIMLAADGAVQTENGARPIKLDAKMRADEALSRFRIEGDLVSGDLALTTTAPVTVMRGEGEAWSMKGPFRIDAGQSIETDIDALWTGRELRASYSARGPSALQANGDVRIPWPLRDASIVRITSSGSGRAEDVWALFAPAETRLGGAVAFDLAFEGPRSNLRPQGALSLSDGTFEHLDAGLVLNAVSIKAAALGNELTFEALSARGVRGGTIEGAGVMSLDGTQDVTIRLNGLRPLRRNDSDGVFNGTLTLQRRDARTSLVGDIQVAQAQLKTDRFNLSRYPTLDVRFEDEPIVAAKPKSESALGLRLDIRLRAERQLEITGRAFDTEWSGDVRLRGTLADPVFVGEADIVRGYVDVAGRRFKFVDSRVQFDGPLDQTRLFLNAERDANDLTAIVRITGALDSPDISFSSDPALPEDEVLSRVLFGQAPSSLGTVDALQLAAGAAELTGGQGFGLFGQLENALGLDSVDAGVDAEGQAFVATGTYIADDVYADVRTNGRGAPRVSVEWTPERNIAIGTSFGASEEPRFTVKWRTDLGAAPEPDKTENPAPAAPQLAE